MGQENHSVSQQERKILILQANFIFCVLSITFLDVLSDSIQSSLHEDWMFKLRTIHLEFHFFIV